MKKFISLLILCLSLAFISQAQGAEEQYFQLKNGLKVLLIEDHRFPLVSTRLFVHGGGAFEDPKHKGISHLLEHMAFNGTQNRPLGKLEEELHAAGGSYNAYTSYDNTVYLVTLPSDEWELSLDVVADITFHPLLEPKLLAKEKDVVKSEIDMGKDNQQRQLLYGLTGLTLKNTPYENTLIGTYETLDEISVNNIRDYRTKYYDPQNMLLVMVGDITKKQVQPEIEKIFGNYTNTRVLEAVEQIDPLSLNYGIQSQVTESSWQKARLGFSMPGPSMKDPRAVPLNILLFLLTGSNNSYLTQELVLEQNLADSLYIGNNDFERVGMLTGMATLDAEKLPAFWAEFTRLLSQVSIDSFTDDDIKQAKFLFTNMYHRSKETIDAIAEIAGTRAFFTPGTSEEDVLFAINQVDREDLQEALDLWIKPQNMGIVALMPNGSTEKGYVPNFEKEILTYWPALSTDKAEEMAQEADEHITLANGSQVILIHDNTMPFFHGELVFKGGDSLLSTEEQGLSSAVASMIGKATENKDRATIEKAFLDMAASVNTAPGREAFFVDMSGPTEYQDEILNLVAEILTEATFTEKDWDKTKSDMIASIKSMDDNPASYLMRRMNPSLFQDNAYGYFTEGTLKTIESFTLPQVEELWAKQINQPWVLTIVGDFSNQIVMDFAEKLPLIEESFKAIEAPTWSKEKRVDYNLADRAQAHIIQIFPTVPRTHPDAPALTVLNNLLGDMSGILFKEFRVNQQLAYSVSPIASQWPAAGFLGYYIGTDPKHIDKIEPSFNKISRDLRTNQLDQKQIDAAKNNIESQYIQSLQPLAARTSEPNVNTLYNRPLDFEQEFMKKIQKVTPRDIQRVAQQYLNPEDSYIFRVLPMN